MYNRSIFTICIFVLSVLVYLNFGCKGEEVLRFDAEADACVRSDLNARRNDNYRCREFMVIGTGREGKPIGGPRLVVTFIPTE
jgi:hypothetical protein